MVHQQHIINKLLFHSQNNKGKEHMQQALSRHFKRMQQPRFGLIIGLSLLYYKVLSNTQTCSFNLVPAIITRSEVNVSTTHKNRHFIEKWQGVRMLKNEAINVPHLH